MPEGHTLRRLADDLSQEFGGRRVRSASPQGRFAAGALQLDDRVFEIAQSHGKHLFVYFADTELAVHVHLGLFGRFTIKKGAAHDLAGAIRWRLEAPEATADLRGPTVCELVDPGDVRAVLARLGPDPLRADADPDDAWRRVSQSRRPIAALLLDQRMIAGVGNVYRAEVLFRQTIDPYLPGTMVSATQWAEVWRDLAFLMAQGVQASRIDTVRAEHEPAVMGREPRTDEHGGEVYVYRRDGLDCLVCGTVVRSATLGNRNLFWCPNCQRSG